MTPEKKKAVINQQMLADVEKKELLNGWNLFSESQPPKDSFFFGGNFRKGKFEYAVYYITQIDVDPAELEIPNFDPESRYYYDSIARVYEPDFSNLMTCDIEEDDFELNYWKPLPAPPKLQIVGKTDELEHVGNTDTLDEFDTSALEEKLEGVEVEGGVNTDNETDDDCIGGSCKI